MARSFGGSWLLVALLVVAVGGGIAAAVLATAPSRAPSTGPTTELFLPAWVVLLPVLIIFGGSCWALFARRGSSAGVPSSNPLIASLLVGMLLLVGFVVISHFVGGGPNDFGATGASAGGSSNNTTTNLTVSNATGATGPGGTLGFLSFPPWVGYLFLFVLVGGFLAVFATSALSLQVRRRSRLGYRPGGASSGAARSALAAAGQALDDGADPRATILILYGRLLDRLTDRMGDVDVATPEEIRTQHLVRLGVQPRDAEALTRLFEEARYSSHPMGDDAAERARVSIRSAMDDLHHPSRAA